jgi:hypothetical protein
MFFTPVRHNFEGRTNAKEGAKETMISFHKHYNSKTYYQYQSRPGMVQVWALQTTTSLLQYIGTLLRCTQLRCRSVVTSVPMLALGRSDTPVFHLSLR